MEWSWESGAVTTLSLIIIKKRAIDDNGKTLGTHNTNILIDTSMYEVEFENGDVELMAANTITENILVQVDKQSHCQLMLGEIIDHRVLEDIIPIYKGTYETKQGVTRRIQTTRGWEIFVEWKDGSTNWVALNDIKDSYPVQLAEYAIANGIEKEAAFHLWVPYTIKKRDRVIKKVKSKYWSYTHFL